MLLDAAHARSETSEVEINTCSAAMTIAAVGWKTNGDEDDRCDSSGRPGVTYAATLGI